jgi:hypothetical protein
MIKEKKLQAAQIRDDIFLNYNFQNTNKIFLPSLPTQWAYIMPDCVFFVRGAGGSSVVISAVVGCLL